MEEDEEKSNDSSDYHGDRIGVNSNVTAIRWIVRMFTALGNTVSAKLWCGKGQVSMNEVEELMTEITRKLPITKEYNQYKSLLDRLKAQPDLYRRVREFRRRSMQIQLGDSGNAVHANSELQNEFRDLQNNGLVNDFFIAEHQYCRMIQSLQERFLEGAGIETDFLEDEMQL